MLPDPVWSWVCDGGTAREMKPRMFGAIGKTTYALQYKIANSVDTVVRMLTSFVPAPGGFNGAVNPLLAPA